MTTDGEAAAHPDFDGHEAVETREGPGLTAVIAIHDSTLGPAVGGCRMAPYPSLGDALGDALRLSRSMTYKSALAGLPMGGGKAVIMGDPARDKTPELLRAMGAFIDALDGRFVGAGDAGVGAADMEVMAGRTAHVSGWRDGGDPSPATAEGVFLGIEACARRRYGAGLKGMRVAVQGVGKVGFDLARRLARAGARVTASDTDPGRLERARRELGVAVCGPGEILSLEAEVLAPCALGGAIRADGVDALRAGVVAGAANNQLAEAALDAVLMERGILYAPDYVINAGGIIDIHHQRRGARDAARVSAHVAEIPRTLEAVFAESERRRRPTGEVADRMAEARFRKAP